MKKSFRKSTKNTLLAGRDTYRDTHGNLIYYNRKKNIAYRITSKDENTFATYRSRYAIALILFIFLYILFNLNIMISAAVSIGAALFLEWRYHSFLGKMVQSTGFVKKDKIRSIDETVDLTTGALVLRVILYGLLSVLLVINTFVSDNVIGNKPIIVISYMVAILAGYMAINYAMMAIRKSKKAE